MEGSSAGVRTAAQKPIDRMLYFWWIANRNHEAPGIRHWGWYRGGNHLAHRCRKGTLPSPLCDEVLSCLQVRLQLQSSSLGELRPGSLELVEGWSFYLLIHWEVPRHDRLHCEGRDASTGGKFNYINSCCGMVCLFWSGSIPNASASNKNAFCWDRWLELRGSARQELQAETSTSFQLKRYTRLWKGIVPALIRQVWLLPVVKKGQTNTGMVGSKRWYEKSHTISSQRWVLSSQDSRHLKTQWDFKMIWCHGIAKSIHGTGELPFLHFRPLRAHSGHPGCFWDQWNDTARRTWSVSSWEWTQHTAITCSTRLRNHVSFWVQMSSAKGI